MVIQSLKEDVVNILFVVASQEKLVIQVSEERVCLKYAKNLMGRL